MLNIYFPNDNITRDNKTYWLIVKTQFNYII